MLLACSLNWLFQLQWQAVAAVLTLKRKIAAVGGGMGLVGAEPCWWTGPGEVTRHICEHQHKLPSHLGN